METSHRLAVVSAGAAATAEVSSTVEDIHHAVSTRLGRLATPLRVPLMLQRTATRGIYFSIRAGAKAVQFASGAAAARAAGDLGQTKAEPRPPSTLFAALACAFGDRMTGSIGLLVPRMGIHLAGQPISPNSRQLREAFPDATGRLTIFLHGLGDTDLVWHRNDDLPREFDRTGLFTCVYLRYNSGLHISENGDLLAELLDSLIQEWPTEVTEIVFVCHSMGGLVVRSACAQTESSERHWRDLVSHIYYLGTPHHGSSIEVVAAAAIRQLERFPETRPLAALANRRSAGIKDLRYGSIVSEDWVGHPDVREDAQHLDLPLMPNTRHHHVAGTVLSDTFYLADNLLGDVMVPVASATGNRGRASRAPFAQDDSHIIRRTSHLGLLRHPMTVRVISEQLDDPIEPDSKNSSGTA